MVVLFDGVCNLCNGVVNFIIDNDPQKEFYFASLQSKFGEEFLKKHNFSVTNYDSFILIDKDKFYTKSTAALIVSKSLKGFWKYFYVFILIPPPIRDAIYSIIAKNRYKWFGKKETCRIPEPGIEDRFL